MNVTPEDRARRAAAAMLAQDPASRAAGIELVSVGPGSAVVTMTVGPGTLQGHGVIHGGLTFMLADTAFAVAANSTDERSVGQHASITYVRPGRVGDVLTARAETVHRSGRNGIVDVRVTNQLGETVAEFRGHLRVVGGSLIEGGRWTPP